MRRALAPVLLSALIASGLGGAVLLGVPDAGATTAAKAMRVLAQTSCAGNTCQVIDSSGGTVSDWYSATTAPSAVCTYAPCHEDGTLVAESGSTCLSAGQEASANWSDPGTSPSGATLCSSWYGIAGEPCTKVWLDDPLLTCRRSTPVGSPTGPICPSRKTLASGQPPRSTRCPPGPLNTPNTSNEDRKAPDGTRSICEAEERHRGEGLAVGANLVRIPAGTATVERTSVEDQRTRGEEGCTSLDRSQQSQRPFLRPTRRYWPIPPRSCRRGVAREGRGGTRRCRAEASTPWCA